MATVPGSRGQFDTWRESDIEFIKLNGFAAAVTSHQQDGGVDSSKKTVKADNALFEHFKLPSDLLWPRDSFVLNFLMEPEEAGYEEDACALWVRGD